MFHYGILCVMYMQRQSKICSKGSLKDFFFIVVHSGFSLPSFFLTEGSNSRPQVKERVAPSIAPHLSIVSSGITTFLYCKIK